MSSAVPSALRKRHIASLRCADHPAGACGHAVIVHWFDGRSISTAPMLDVEPVLSTVKVKTVPVVSFRYWTSGATDALAAKGAATTPVGSATRMSVAMATTRRRGTRPDMGSQPPGSGNGGDQMERGDRHDPLVVGQNTCRRPHGLDAPRIVHCWTGLECALLQTRCREAPRGPQSVGMAKASKSTDGHAATPGPRRCSTCRASVARPSPIADCFRIRSEK